MAASLQNLTDLVARMTVAEKAGQLTMITGEWSVTGPKAMPLSMDAIRSGAAGSILNLWSPPAVREAQRAAVEESPLGIPLLMGFDVVHGHRTIFPVPLGEAASFEPDLWRRTAEAAAEEAASDGITLTFAPMIDVARDPRWGRICEGPGEDPVLAAAIGKAKTAGFQGTSLSDPTRIAATAKHLGAYGAVLAGRDYASADVSPREMEEVHLPAFEEAVNAGVAAVMPSFNDIAGIPSTANRDLLHGYLRQRLGFAGVIISDYNAIAELIRHGVAAGTAEAAALALRAGVDIDMMGGIYLDGLGEALARGLVAMAEIDAAVLRVLRLKARLGLFADPYRGLVSGDAAGVRHRPLAREAAGNAVVLLKNQSACLPLGRSGGTIAVVGPLADSQDDMLGSWSAAGRAEDCVTFVTGIRAAFPGRSVLNAQGSTVTTTSDDMIGAAVAAAAHADTIILCAGESRAMSGEASCRGEPDLPEAQRRLARALLETGKPVILVISSGRPVILPDWLVAGAHAILATWFLGSEAGSALGDILSGATSPSGRLPVTWPAASGQIPIYYAERRSGRPADPAQRYSSKYLDIPVEPLFPFGHGLSYTVFRVENLRVENSVVAVPGMLEVSVEAVNIGKRAGAITLLLFIQDPVASIARPVLLLKAFAKLEAAAGERIIARFSLSTDVLAFPGIDLRPRIENGRIDILVGERAVESELLRASIEITGGVSHTSRQMLIPLTQVALDVVS